MQALRRVTNTVELYHELYTLIIIHNLLCWRVMNHIIMLNSKLFHAISQLHVNHRAAANCMCETDFDSSSQFMCDTLCTYYSTTHIQYYHFVNVKKKQKIACRQTEKNNNQQIMSVFNHHDHFIRTQAP